MIGSRVRSVNFTTNENGQNTQLIQPTLSNLTISPVPNDRTNIVICKPNRLGLADKLDALINQYSSQIIRIASTGSCASAFTAKVPMDFIDALSDTLNVNDNNCLQETSLLLSMLSSYKMQVRDGYINIPRNFWGQMSRCFTELNVNESKINTSVSMIQSASMAIVNDAQSLPSNNLLQSTLLTLNDLALSTTSPIDPVFETTYPESLLPQIDPTEALSDVINNVPTAIGETSSIPPTNLVDLNASDNAENIQIHNLDTDDTIEAQAYHGLKELFSTKYLTVPINKLRIIHGGKVSTTKITTLSYIKNEALDTGTIDVIEAISVDVSSIDTSKTLLEQDWVMEQISVSLTPTPVTYYRTCDMVTDPMVLSLNEITRFKGINSRKEYTLIEARALGSSLTAIWKKVASMKLPTPEHIQAGTSILATGLGVAGSLFGSSGLIKASTIMGSLSNGLGNLMSNITVTNGLSPGPRASMAKNALAVVPSIIEAGKSEYEKTTINAQDQRLRLNGLRKEVESGFTIPLATLAGRATIKRINLRDNSVFY